MHIDLAQQFRKAQWLRSFLVVQLRNFILLAEIIEKSDELKNCSWFVIKNEGPQRYCDNLVRLVTLSRMRNHFQL